MSQTKPARAEKKQPGIGGPVTWALDTALLWAITVVVPTLIAVALAGRVSYAWKPIALEGYAVAAGSGLILGLIWRALVARTALGLALLAVLVLAPAAFIAGRFGLAAAHGLAFNPGVNTVVLAAAMTVQSIWFTAVFAVRGAQQESRWWLLVVAAVLAAPLAFVS
jgi:hypothetical protein